jgi:alpha-1,2-mannosyltransferase
MMAQTSTGTWLTTKRLLAHGTILLVCLWSLYLWNLATPGLRDRAGNLKGTDFLHFYTLGYLARTQNGAALYDMNTQAILAVQRVPQAAGIRYLPLYPPQVSILFAPLAYLSYPLALALWWVLCSVIYALCCYTMWRASSNLRQYRDLVFLLAAAFPPFFHLIAWGQTSALALLCFTAAFFSLQNKRDFLAGLFLGSLVFKPQLGIAAAILFLALFRWKILAAAILSGAGQLCTGVLYYGLQPLRQWWSELQHVNRLMSLLEPKPYQTHSLRTFWSMLVPWHAISLGLYLVSCIAILFFLIMSWRRPSAPLSLKYSALLVATVLVAPHLTVYDLVILAPAILVLADWVMYRPATRSMRTLATLLYFVYVLPLIGPFAIWTHVQLSVVAMAMTMFLTWKMSASAEDRATVPVALASIGHG